MARKVDYSKIKAMASSILECIGEDEEGENPKLPKDPVNPTPKPTDFGDREEESENAGGGGASPNLDFLGKEEDVSEETGKKKKSKDSSIAMFAANLASKCKK